MAEDDTIPTGKDILDGIPAALYQHGDLLTAQARSVIAGAIKNQEDPATIGSAFAAELMRQVIDDYADISDAEATDMISKALYLARGVSIGRVTMRKQMVRDMLQAEKEPVAMCRHCETWVALEDADCPCCGASMTLKGVA